MTEEGNGDGYPLPQRLTDLSRSEGVDIETIQSGADYYEFRREVFEFAENFKPNAAGEYSELYHRLVQDSTLSEREAQVATMKIAGMTHGAILLFYEIMDRETADEKDYPTSITTINEYSQRARKKYKQAVATVNHLKPVFGDAELWQCPECGKQSAAPETERGSKFILKITCPHCGASDYQEGPGARFA